jgi:hypothetical protein
MKLLFYPYVRIAAVLVVWGHCIWRYTKEFDHDYWLKEEITAFWVIVSVIVSLLFSFIEYCFYRLQRKANIFKSSLLTLCCVVALINIRYRLEQQDVSPVVYTAGYSKLFSTSIRIDFRQDGTYRCSFNTGLFGDTYRRRGRYHWHPSTVQLLDSNVVDWIQSTRLLIKSTPPDLSTLSKKANLMCYLLTGPEYPSYEDSLPTTILIPLDAKGHPVDSTFTFILLTPDRLLFRQDF